MVPRLNVVSCEREALADRRARIKTGDVFLIEEVKVLLLKRSANLFHQVEINREIMNCE